MLILNRKEIEDLADLKDVIEAVEEAFLEVSRQTAICPKRLIIGVKKHEGTAFFMPTYLGGMDVLATKIVTQYFENPVKHGLPAITASIILNDSRTGKMLAVMEGTYITALRTGAFSALATKYLARKDSKVVGIMGTGVQAQTQILAVQAVLKEVREVKAFDLFPERAKKFATEISGKLKLKARAVKTSKECVEDSDIIITATTSTMPVLDGDWVKSGAHINSIGWMGPSGRELDDKLVRKARLVVDTIEGVLAESGDLLIPIRAGIISKNHIYAELEEVVSGKKPGRLHDDEITCFKSVGFAIGDAATAWCIYKRAVSGKVGTLIDF